MLPFSSNSAIARRRWLSAALASPATAATSAAAACVAARSFTTSVSACSCLLEVAAQRLERRERRQDEADPDRRAGRGDERTATVDRLRRRPGASRRGDGQQGKRRSDGGPGSLVTRADARHELLERHI